MTEGLIVLGMWVLFLALATRLIVWLLKPEPPPSAYQGFLNALDQLERGLVPHELWADELARPFRDPDEWEPWRGIRTGDTILAGDDVHVKIRKDGTTDFEHKHTPDTLWR